MFDKRKIDPSETVRSGRLDVDAAIVDYLRTRSSATAREMAEESGLARSTISSHINALIDRGEVEPTEPARSPKQRYRLTRK